MVRMRVNFPGYVPETLRSGGTRHRVRVQGKRAQRITLPIGPDHPQFQEAYLAARAGETFTLATPEPTKPGSLGWLVAQYLDHLAALVASDSASPLTLLQRKGLAADFLTHTSTSERSHGRAYRDLPASIPQAELIRLRDSLTSTPGKQKNMFKFLRALFKFAVDRGHVAADPAAGVKVITRSKGGTTPWTLDDLAKYRARHPAGTMAHLALTLFMFAAPRLDDARQLGHKHITRRGGRNFLAWTPAKKGSTPVIVPILPPLQRAIDAQKIAGSTFILSTQHRPFSSRNSFGAWFKKQCVDAELPDRSAHGIRKSAGHLLALHGATQHQIMAVHGHANASTSEIYTQGVEREALALQAMDKLAGLEW